MTSIRFPTSGGDYVDDGERLSLVSQAEAQAEEVAETDLHAAADEPLPVPAVPRKPSRRALTRTDEE